MDDFLDVDCDEEDTEESEEDNSEVSEQEEEENKPGEESSAPPESAAQEEKPASPSSYTQNSPEEELMLAIAENFRRQYAVLFPERRAPLLCPVNEHGIPKFISTTLRRTMLPYYELYDWRDCAGFVSDRLILESLSAPFELPKQLSSPTRTLQTQRGTCLEFATVLCSLLLGSGYDAYCVSGYATKELCLLDQSQEDCPVLPSRTHEEPEEQKQDQNGSSKKYVAKEPQGVCSNLEKQHEQMRISEAEAAVWRKRDEEERRQRARERPPPDPYQGLRVHCWVLLLSGKRDVPETLFIDALSGRACTPSNKNFLGIESVWNDRNYWVNKQICSFGCGDMAFDLADLSIWEYMFCGHRQNVPYPANVQESGEEVQKAPKVFEMPRTWVNKIEISPSDVEKRYPEGSKSIWYRKARLEKFAPYLLKEGLVTRLTTYKDLQCTQSALVKEWFQHRSDQLEEREFQVDTRVTVEYFKTGRRDALKLHRYISLVPESRQMDFYGHIELDSLTRRVEKPLEVTETFDNRSDFLFYRHVVYGKSKKMADAADEQRPLVRVEERFHRDPSKPGDTDVAKWIFLMSERKIQVTYHQADDSAFQSWVHFIKPKEAAGSDRGETFTSKMASSFQADPEKHYSFWQLYEILTYMIAEEEKFEQKISGSEEKIRLILAAREREENVIKLEASVYDSKRNKAAKNRRRRKKKEKLKTIF